MSSVLWEEGRWERRGGCGSGRQGAPVPPTEGWGCGSGRQGPPRPSPAAGGPTDDGLYRNDVDEERDTLLEHRGLDHGTVGQVGDTLEEKGA